MIIDSLKLVLEKNKSAASQFFIRNLLKEKVQDYILNFVYNHPKYKKWIFTGGTCLRKAYGLTRLSEDLDFNFLQDFNVNSVSTDLKNYFLENLQYKDIGVKISGNKKTIFLKFPVLAELGLAKTSADVQLLFVRCDFAQETAGSYNTEINTISSDEFSFFILSYDMPTLFANKIVAFLQRKYFKGKDQKIPFKGRDLFDLNWFFARWQKSGAQFQPNWQRIFKQLKTDNKEKVMKMLKEKIERLNERDVIADLIPFFADAVYIKNFAKNFPAIFKNYFKTLT